MLTIIGCGNTKRSDDGVGVVVAQRLAARGSGALILIDASRTGGEAGTLHWVPGEELARVPEPSCSLHDFRWEVAERALRTFRQESREPLEIAGFEPLDVLQALRMVVQQITEGRAVVENHDQRVVNRSGNAVAWGAEHAARAREAMRAHPRGRDAAIIGRGRAEPRGVVTMSTGFGGERVVALPVGEQLPRIC